MHKSTTHEDSIAKIIFLKKSTTFFWNFLKLIINIFGITQKIRWKNHNSKTMKNRWTYMGMIWIPHVTMDLNFFWTSIFRPPCIWLEMLNQFMLVIQITVDKTRNRRFKWYVCMFKSLTYFFIQLNTFISNKIHRNVNDRNH